MESFEPASFSEALGGLLLIVATVSAVFSLCPCLRIHALRLLAIFVVASLALFSNSTTTYFVAIFVIATAVTELEFLQNLAAIVRGNKDYFDYKKETLSVKEKLNNLASEAKQSLIVVDAEPDLPSDDAAKVDVQASYEEYPNSTEEQQSQCSSKQGADSSASEPPKTDCSDEAIANSDSATSTNGASWSFSKGQSINIRKIYEFESKALDKLEITYGRAIERGVALQKATSRVELDGLISNYKAPGMDMIFEVKYLPNSRNFIPWLGLMSPKLNKLVESYRKITGRLAVIHFVIIIGNSEMLTMRQRRVLSSLDVDSVTLFRSGEFE